MLIAFLAIGILGVYTFLTFRKKLAIKELILRSSLLAISLLCLCLLSWKPQFQVKQITGKALLLTENTSEIPDSIPVFALENVKVSSSVKKIYDIAYIERNFPEIAQIYVSGYNLPPEQISNLKRIKVNFIDKQIPSGFSWLTYTKQIKVGERLKINGTFNNPAEDTVKLLLETVEGLQDSVLLLSGNHQFSLQARPQLTGHFTGTIRIKKNKNIRNEPLPYQVEPKTPLHILILQNFPVFETNYLKEWLTRQKHEVQIQSRISREKYTTQFINLADKRTSASLLATKTLEKADLLIIDDESLRQFSFAEQNNLKKAIEEGLGLLLLPDEKWLQRKEVLGFRFSINTADSKQFQPHGFASIFSSKSMTEKIPANFSANSTIIPVITSNTKETITAFLPSGKGRIGVQLATATFPWILNGEEKLYSDFWTEVIQALSRRKIQKELKIAELPFIWQNNLTTIVFADTISNPVVIKYSSGKKQSIFPKNELSDISTIAYSFYPSETGWTDFYFQNDSTQAKKLYILPTEKWKDLKQADWWRKNQKSQTNFLPASPQTFTTFREIPLLWFFVLFVFSAGWLWWRER